MLSGILIRAPSRVVFVPGCGCVFDPPAGSFIATQTEAIWVKVETWGRGKGVCSHCALMLDSLPCVLGNHRIKELLLQWQRC